MTSNETEVTYTHEERAARRKESALEVKAGNDPRKVARKFGVTLATLRNSCAANQVEWPMLPRLQRKSAKSLKMIAMMLDGKKDAEIAEKFKVSRQQVNRVRQDAREAGVIKKGRGE